MKINERFSINRDKYNYILVERGEYINPETGEISHPESKSFYPDLECACRGALKRSVDTTDLQTVISTIQKAQREISAAIVMCGGVI